MLDQSPASSPIPGLGLHDAGVPPPARRPSGEIVALTSLRGIAAMAVVLQHFSATAQLHCAVTIPSLIPHGYLAVDLFFALSGFIMGYTYLDVFQHQGMRAFAGFLGKRLARIAPLNTVVVLLFLLAGGISTLLLGRNIVFHSTDLLLDIPINLLMLQGFLVGHNLNGPSWSVSTEFAAYGLFPLLAALVFARRAMIWGMALAISVLLLCWIAAGVPRWGMDAEAVPRSLIRCLAEFTLGIGCYRLFLQESATHWLGRDTVSLALIALCGGFMLLRVDLPAALLFPGLIVSLASNRGRLAQVLSWAWLRFLGLVSFSLYLIHQLFRPLDLALLTWWHPAPLGGPAALLFALLASLAVIPFAWLAYVAVERPGRVIVRYGLEVGSRRGARA